MCVTLKPVLWTCLAVALAAVSTSTRPAVAGEVLFVPNEYSTIQQAVDASEPGDQIVVGEGEYAGAVITEHSVSIRGSGPATRITSGNWLWSSDAFDIFGPAHGTEISNLTIAGLGWGVYAEYADDVTVTRVTCEGVQQGIVNWNGSGWKITHNDIQLDYYEWRHHDGIIVGSWDPSTPASGNLVAFNTVEQTATGAHPDYEAFAGIFVGSFGDEVEDNNVVHNVVSIDVDGTLGVPAGGIVLLDGSLDAGGPALVQDNTVGFNDVRGSYDAAGPSQLDFSPPSLVDLNLVSRNLGHDRRAGEPGYLFNPVK